MAIAAEGRSTSCLPDPTAGRPSERPRGWRRDDAHLVAVGLTLLAGVLAFIGWSTLAGDHALSQVLMSAEGQMVGPALLAFVAVVFLAERRWPAVARPALDRAHIVDASYLIMFACIGPVVTMMSTGIANVVQHYARFLVLRRLPVVPQAVVVAVLLVALDAGNWAAHGASHRWEGLWRVHALHHSQEDMSVLTTFRTHPLSHASYLPALVPALILAANGTLPEAAVIAYACLVTLPHANLRWTFGPFGRIVVSPAYHRLHHASVPVGDRQAVNFGFVLVCWDRLAGCSVQPAGSEPVPTGIAGRSVPIEQGAAGPSRVPGIVLAQLVQPLRSRSAMGGQP